jgi:hypothetical protein
VGLALQGLSEQQNSAVHGHGRCEKVVNVVTHLVPAATMPSERAEPATSLKSLRPPQRRNTRHPSCTGRWWPWLCAGVRALAVLPPAGSAGKLLIIIRVDGGTRADMQGAGDFEGVLQS